MKRLGSAETGVSITMLELPCEGCETGWTGRANGFGGPVAPAESKADADGEGGGNTTPEEWESDPRPFRARLPAALTEECGLELSSAVALPPPSDASSGICTFKTGRLPPPMEAEFVLEGG